MVRCSYNVTVWDDAALHTILVVSNAELLADMSGAFQWRCPSRRGLT